MRAELNRIVLLTRHYPPAVSGLAPRTRGLAQALRAEGARVFVVAPSLPEGEEGLAVAHPHRDPATSGGEAPRFDAKAFARELLLWPDPDIRWSMRAARAAADACGAIDWVLSASPPESAHVAGRWLARRLGARWAGDFTDLWLHNPHRLERKRAWRRLGEGLVARDLLRGCDLALAVDAVIADELRGFGARDPRVLAHFVPDVAPAAITLPSDRINVVCTGAFTLSFPENRIEPLLRVFEAGAARNQALMLHLVGRLTDAEQAACARSAYAGSIVVHGPQSHERARGFQVAADGLIFSCTPELHVPPSKIVEYLSTDAPIIAVGEGSWREDPRTPRGDPVEALAALRKGAKREPGLPAPPTARDTARALLSMMAALEGGREPAKRVTSGDMT